jgi:hypothetical protein
MVVISVIVPVIDNRNDNILATSQARVKEQITHLGNTLGKDIEKVKGKP